MMRRSPLCPRFLTLALCLTGLSLLALAPQMARSLPQSPPREALLPTGSLPKLTTRVEGVVAALPLEHTDVAITVSGFVASVDLAQRFGNPYEVPIEAVYVFPLPEHAAVDAFRMRIGERVIEGKIKKRETARRIYQAARRAGHTAALLEQERPNIFTQSVANIAPGETIVVTLHLVQTLAYDEGAFELAFPMVVGPRFFPGTPKRTSTAGSDITAGVGTDTDEMPDASRQSPPRVPDAMRSGHDITLRVALQAGLPIRDFEVPTHDVDVRAEGDTGLTLALAEHARIPNRDFVLRWWVDADAVQAGLLTHTDDRGKFFSLMIVPPRLDVDALVGDRELIFVVDVSGSMLGLPLWLARKAMRTALSRVRPGDTFNVITFAGVPGRLWDKSRPATGRNIELAQAFIKRMSAGGGTQILDAVAAALEGEIASDRHRYVFFLTDGYVGNEKEIVAAARHYVAAHDRSGRRARVFTLGIGASVNRLLVDGLAKAGRGTAFVATHREDPARAVDAFFRRIDHPVLVDLALDFGALPVRPQSIYPRRLPDLFASRPLLILGRYDRSGRGVITLRARTEDGRVIRMPITVDLPPLDTRSTALPSLWAREKIQALDDSLWDAGRGLQRNKLPDIRHAITRLGLEYRLLTAYTAFVAVDPSRVVGNGAPTRIAQPVEIPEGVAAGALGIRALGLGGGGYASGVGGLGMRGSMGRGAGGLAGSLAGGVGGGVASGATRKLGGGLAEVLGSLDRGVVQRVVRLKQAKVSHCYAQALARRPALAGKVIVSFTIQPDGSVRGARIATSSLGDDGIEACLLSEVATWHFPAPAGGGVVKVRYPWRFSSTASASGTASGPALRMTIGAALRVEGGRDQERVFSFLWKEREAFSRCHPKTSGSALPGTGGKVLLRFSVTPDGRSEAMHVVRDTLKQPKLTHCLLKALALLRFPASRSLNTTRIELPLIFAPPP